MTSVYLESTAESRSSILGSIIRGSFRRGSSGGLVGRAAVPVDYIGDLGRRPVQPIVHHHVVEPLRLGHLLVDRGETPVEGIAELGPAAGEAADELLPRGRLQEHQ